MPTIWKDACRSMPSLRSQRKLNFTLCTSNNFYCAGPRAGTLKSHRCPRPERRTSATDHAGRRPCFNIKQNVLCFDLVLHGLAGHQGPASSRKLSDSRTVQLPLLQFSDRDARIAGTNPFRDRSWQAALSLHVESDFHVSVNINSKPKASINVPLKVWVLNDMAS